MNIDSQQFRNYNEGMRATHGEKSFYTQDKPVTFTLPDNQSRHYCVIPFSSDCLYDIEFIPSAELQIEKIELICEQREQIFSLFKEDNKFVGFTTQEPLMLILIPKFDVTNFNGLGVLQYQFTYTGSGTVTYSCKKGYFAEKSRRRLLEREKNGRIQVGNIIYHRGLCYKKDETMLEQVCSKLEEYLSNCELVISFKK